MHKNEARFGIYVPQDDSKSLKNDILQALAGVNLDIITQNPPKDECVQFFISSSGKNTQQISEILQNLQVKFTLDQGLDKLSILGIGVKTNIAVLYGVLMLLNENGIPIVTVSTSEVKISLLVKHSGEAARDLLQGFAHKNS